MSRIPSAGSDARSVRTASSFATAVAFCILAATMLLALGIGSVPIPLHDIARILLTGILHRPAHGTVNGAWAQIILEIRMPRVVLGALVGAVLAVAGAAYQAVFRNPLADPYLIGVSSGASFGATLAMLLLWAVSWHGVGIVSLTAFACAVTVTFAAFRMSRVGGQTSTTLLILAGVALGALLSAGTTLLLFSAPSAYQSIQILQWLLGSLATASWQGVLVLLPFAVIGLVFPIAGARHLDVIQLGDDEASVLGARVERVRTAMITAVTLSTASAVAVCGVIGFVGLVIPHIGRLLCGPRHRAMLPTTAAAGGVLLLLADIVARSAAPPREIPLGVVTAAIGVPFFLVLLRRRHRLTV